MPVLEVTTGPHTGRTISLSPGVSVRIGRTPKSDYVVAEDTFLSGAHFMVECSGELCIVRDLNSSNGTFLNGTRTSEAALHEGDVITAGQSSFAFHAGDAQGAPALDETRPMPASFFGDHGALGKTEPAPPGAPPLPPWAPQPPGMPQSYGPTQQPPPAGQPYIAPTTFEPAMFPPGAPPLPGAPPVPGAPPQAPPPYLPTSVTPEPPPVSQLSASQRAMLDILLGLADQVYGLVDGSAAATLVGSARASGATVEVLSDATGACLFPLNAESPLGAQFAMDGWGRGWGIFVTSRQPAAILRNHLRRFQTMLSSDGVEFQFRMYNPALMRGFVANLSGEEAKAFFGPIGAMLMEGNTADELVLFMPGSGGTLQKVIPLGSGSAAQA